VIRDDSPSVACRGGPGRRYEQLGTELPTTIENIGSGDQRGVAEFFVLLGLERFDEYVAEMVETLETGRDPGAFWAKWIDVVVERTLPLVNGPTKQ